MKKSLLLIAGILIIVVAVIKFKNNDLHSARISGTIEKCLYSIHKPGNSESYTTISINKTEYKVIFTPAAGSEFTFADVARVGDTIFKAANNDTLILKRVGDNDNDGFHFSFIVKARNDN